MNSEHEITAFYRAAAKGEPPSALDKAILQAARHQRNSARETGSLAALAAALILAVVVSLPERTVQPYPPEAATYGLYESAGSQFVVSSRPWNGNEQGEP